MDRARPHDDEEPAVFAGENAGNGFARSPYQGGVIVAAGYRRGVLLPDLEGIATAAEQVDIALQKAGIRPDEQFSLRRFTVTRYCEGERSGELPEETGEVDG